MHDVPTCLAGIAVCIDLSTGNSTTKLPAGAFGSPSKYYAEETKEVVQQIMEYFSTNKKAFPTLLEVFNPFAPRFISIQLLKPIKVYTFQGVAWSNKLGESINYYRKLPSELKLPEQVRCNL